MKDQLIETIEDNDLKLHKQFLISEDDDMFTTSAEIRAVIEGSSTVVKCWDLGEIENFENFKPSMYCQETFAAGTHAEGGQVDKADYDLKDPDQKREYDEAMAIAFHIGCKQFDKANFQKIRKWAEAPDPEHQMWAAAVKAGVIKKESITKLRALAKKFGSSIGASLENVNLKQL